MIRVRDDVAASEQVERTRSHRAWPQGSVALYIYRDESLYGGPWFRGVAFVDGHGAVRHRLKGNGVLVQCSKDDALRHCFFIEGPAAAASASACAGCGRRIPKPTTGRCPTCDWMRDSEAAIQEGQRRAAKAAATVERERGRPAVEESAADSSPGLLPQSHRNLDLAGGASRTNPRTSLQRWSAVAATLMAISTCCVGGARLWQFLTEGDSNPPAGATTSTTSGFTGPGGVTCSSTTAEVMSKTGAGPNPQRADSDAGLAPDLVAENDDGISYTSYWLRDGRFARAVIQWRALRMFAARGNTTWPMDLLAELEARLGTATRDDFDLGEYAIIRASWSDGTMSVRFVGAERDTSQSGARTGMAAAFFECPSWTDAAHDAGSRALPDPTSGLAVELPTAQRWWCACFHEDNGDGDQIVTGCRATRAQCARLEDAAAGSGSRTIIPASLVASCSEISGEPATVLGGDCWVPSARRGGWACPGACRLQR